MSEKDKLAEEKSKKRKSVVCCIPNCHNSYVNTRNISFYCFPNRPYERERREKWINFVNKAYGNTDQWKPNQYSRICSGHFYGGEKSNDPNNPAYLPQVLNPEKSIVQGMQIVARYKRFKNRSNISTTEKSDCSLVSVSESVVHDTVADDAPIVLEVSTNILKKNKSVQAFNSAISNNFEFSCTFHGLNVSTQANICSIKAFVYSNPTTDTLCGPDSAFVDNSFQGYNSKWNEETFKKLTSVSKKVFELFLSKLTVAQNCKVSKENRLLIFLMKMKSGLSYEVLSVLFSISPSTVSTIFVDVLLKLSAATKNLIFWPDKEVIQDTMPIAFKTHYPNCRGIIDCTEIKIEQPSTVEQRVYTYSAYKSAYTFKFLVVISPSGAIIFKSKCYGGRATDAFITTNSGLLNLIEPGDFILADKGFPTIKQAIEDKSALLVLPPFLHDGHLSNEEIEETYNIASVRIHVERAIQRLKIYNILQKIKHDLFSYIDDIVHMCCVMVNLQTPIIKR